MESLLDPDGPWSPDLINLMTPVAEEAETKDAARQFNAVLAATSSLFNPEAGKEYRKLIGDAMQGIRNAQLRARGQAATSKGDVSRKRDAGRALQEGFAKLGIQPVRMKPGRKR